MSNSEKMTQRVRGLFSKAESVAGTPEADVFLAKAMELLAKYGIDEAVAKAGAGTDSSEIVEYQFRAKGAYKFDQVMLVGAVAQALHCMAVRSGADKSLVTVYGAKRHVERLEMLVGFLAGHMLATVSKAKSEDPRVSTVTMRKSVAAGYTNRIAARLREAERDAAEESSDSSGAEIVLASDAKRAEQYMNNKHRRLRSAGNARRSSVGYGAGSSAANSVDLGGGGRVGGRSRAAIGA